MSRAILVFRSALSAAICLAGVALAVVEVPVPDLILLAGLGIGLGLTAYQLSLNERRQRCAQWLEQSPRGSRLRAGCLGALAGASVTGLIAGMGWGGVVMAGLMAMAWPGTARWALDLMLSNGATRWLRSIVTRPPAGSRRSSGSRPSLKSPSSPGAGPTVEPGTSVELHALLGNWPERLHSMSDGSICYVWVTSSEQLRRPLPALERLANVMSRAYVLDELERRDPQGFTAWTASRVSMAMNPRRFINSTPGTDRLGPRPVQED